MSRRNRKRKQEEDQVNPLHQELKRRVGHLTLESLEVAANACRLLLNDGPLDPSMTQIEGSPSTVRMLKRAHVPPCQGLETPEVMAAIEEIRQTGEQACALAQRMSRLIRDLLRKMQEACSSRAEKDPVWNVVSRINTMIEQTGLADAELLAELELLCKGKE